MRLTEAQLKFLRSMVLHGHPHAFCKTMSDHGGVTRTVSWAVRNGLASYNFSAKDPAQRFVLTEKGRQVAAANGIPAGEGQ